MLSIPTRRYKSANLLQNLKKLNSYRWQNFGPTPGTAPSLRAQSTGTFSSFLTKNTYLKCFRSGTENLTMQNTTQQLHEVQAKLRTLKSKLWFGAGEGNTLPSSVIPLSWGTSKFCETKTNRKPKR